MRVNRYKMKHGTTILDIENYAKEFNYVFSKGGTWISDDAEYVMFIALNDSISLDIAFPGDIEKWNDCDYVLVINEKIGQPYGPFRNCSENPDSYLEALIGKYNETMYSLYFLEKAEQ